MQGKTSLAKKEETACPTLEQGHVHDIATLAAEIQRLRAHYGQSLKEGDIRKEMERLEEWLEQERKGPAPAKIISAGGITWLTELRDRLRLAAEETERFEDEGGTPRSAECQARTEGILNVIRRIDKILDENPHPQQ